MKFHPLFFLVAIYFIAAEKASLFAGYTIAIIVHEYSHYLVAKALGYSLGAVKIMPYGGRISGYTYNSFFDGMMIAFAGPIANIVLSLVIMSSWSLINNAYDYTINIIRSNIYLALVNLLPIYPLDGSQIVFLFSKNKIRMAKRLKVISIIFGAIFIALSIVSIFYSMNVTLSIFGIFLIISTIFDKDKLLYEYVSLRSIRDKESRGCYKLVSIVVDKEVPLSKLFAMINKEDVKEFIIQGSNIVISEKNLIALSEQYPIDTKLKEICL
ncbi:MAG: hypothetical protein MSH40_03610 [Christensenella sp.]|nr:hypothetical protein [Christensenella sp.]